MIGRITATGSLEMLRNGHWRWQPCPFQDQRPYGHVSDQPHVPVFCGDWCPLFHEGGEAKLHNHWVAFACGASGFSIQIQEDQREAAPTGETIRLWNEKTKEFDDPIGKVPRAWEELRDAVAAQREEILRAFIAKYGCGPDECEQVVERGFGGVPVLYSIRKK